MLKEEISVLHHALLCIAFSLVYALLPLFSCLRGQITVQICRAQLALKVPRKLSFAASGHSCFYLKNKQPMKSVEDIPKCVFGVNSESVYWNMTLHLLLWQSEVGDVYLEMLTFRWKNMGLCVSFVINVRRDLVFWSFSLSWSLKYRREAA